MHNLPLLSIAGRPLVPGALFLLLFFTSTGTLHAEDKTTPHGLIKECFDEPIFNNNACIYHNRLQTQRQNILFIHGINGNALDWQAQIEPLIDDYNLLLPDLPGFGASSSVGAEYTPDNYVRFIKFISERFSNKAFILVGHSLGAAIALQYTALYPDEIERVLVADVAGVLHKIAYAKSVTDSWTSGFFGEKFGRFLGGATGEWMSRVEGSRQPGTEPKAGTAYAPGTIASYALIYSNFSPYIPMIKTPVQLIWEQDDKIAPLRTGQALAAQLDNSYLDIIPGQGHAPMRNFPALFNQKMLAFLQATDGELAEKSRHQKALPRDGKDNWAANCKNRRNMEFEGDFESLELHQCAGIRIINSTIRKLTLYESRVEIVNSRIGILHATGSDASITASRLEGDVPLTVSRSRIDLAGVRLKGNTSSVNTLIPSELIFSISEVDSPIFTGPMHGLVLMETGEKL